jgi:hypothetical protein
MTAAGCHYKYKRQLHRDIRFPKLHLRMDSDKTSLSFFIAQDRICLWRRLLIQDKITESGSSLQ